VPVLTLDLRHQGPLARQDLDNRLNSTISAPAHPGNDGRPLLPDPGSVLWEYVAPSIDISL